MSEKDRKREANKKNEASIKYNYEDFLKQFDNLTDQCRHFVETLCLGSQECLICQNPIF